MICDCFPFFQELDILEWRLEELYSVVDHFVLVESTHTHKGDEKPMHYARNRQRFARYNDKIIHVVVDEDTVDGMGLPAIRRRELGQRNAILRGLETFTDDAATVLISDVDEIPRREIIRGLAAQTLPDGYVVRFIQKLHYFNLNTYAPDRPWPGTRAARLADVRALSPHVIRTGLGQPDAHYPLHGVIPDAGWHFSYFGGTERIQAKMGAFLHQELVSEANADPTTIEARVKDGIDIWGRENEQTFVIGAASDLPWAIRSEPDRWLEHFHPDWTPTFHERWYTATQAAYVGWLAQQAPEGAIVEIGCWEGRSTVCLAQSVAPRKVYAIDHWRGNEEEYEGHPSANTAAVRDIYGVFRRNLDVLTSGGVSALHSDWRAWVNLLPSNHDPRIAFLHLDAAHDYESVKDCLLAIRPFLVPGAILCGDDYYAAGVHRAVNEVLAGAQDVGGRLWVWQNTEGL